MTAAHLTADEEGPWHALSPSDPTVPALLRQTPEYLTNAVGLDPARVSATPGQPGARGNTHYVTIS